MSQKCKLPKKGSPGEIWTGFRNSRSHMFFKISFLKNLANSTGKRLCWRLFLIKLQSWRYYRKRPQHRYFSVKLAKIFRPPFLQNRSSGYFWHWTRIFKEVRNQNRCDCQRYIPDSAVRKYLLSRKLVAQ